MNVPKEIEAAFRTLVSEVRQQALLAGDFNEERLTAPCRKLLEALHRPGAVAGVLLPSIV